MKKTESLYSPAIQKKPLHNQPCDQIPGELYSDCELLFAVLQAACSLIIYNYLL